jgi:hypothetical protein
LQISRGDVRDLEIFIAKASEMLIVQKIEVEEMLVLLFFPLSGEGVALYIPGEDGCLCHLRCFEISKYLDGHRADPDNDEFLYPATAPVHKMSYNSVRPVTEC